VKLNRRRWTVQAYPPGGANVNLHLTHALLCQPQVRHLIGWAHSRENCTLAAYRFAHLTRKL